MEKRCTSIIIFIIIIENCSLSSKGTTWKRSLQQQLLLFFSFFLRACLHLDIHLSIYP